jgi:hypothetical protein
MANENNKVTIETDSLGRIIIDSDKLERVIDLLGKEGMGNLSGFICKNQTCSDLPIE